MYYILLANGFEDIEALAPLDVMRRAGIETQTVAVGENPVTSKAGVRMYADIHVSQAGAQSVDGVIIPGGVPGVDNLEKSEDALALIKKAADNKSLIAAICAGPSIPGKMGILSGADATCYPGYEKHMAGARVKDAGVVTSGNIVTAKGAGFALEFAYEIVSYIAGADASRGIAAAMQFINRQKSE